MTETALPHSRPADRLHALDAVRAFALLLGIALHATMPWVGVPWAAGVEQPSDVLVTVFYVIHMFRMPVFFLIAGFFGRMLLGRLGTRDFIKDRSKRILVPFVIGLPVLAVLSVAALVLGALAAGENPQAPPSPEGGPPPYVLAHLWFLYYLIIFYAGALLARWALDRFMEREGRLRLALDTGVGFIMSRIWGAALLAVPVFVCLYLGGWVGHPGAPVFLTPELGGLVIYGTAFGFGWLLQRQPKLVMALQKNWVVHVVLAVGLTLVSASMLLAKPRGMPFAEVRDLLTHSAVYALGTWCWMFGLIGVAIRYLSAMSPVRRYLADSSYWLYLVHIPVLFFFQRLLGSFPWHWSVEYSVTIAGAMPLLLLSYHYLVRFTFLGAILNGRRRHRSVVAEPAAPTPGVS